MNWLVCHIASGHSFTGVALVIGGVLAAPQVGRRWQRLAVLTVLIGVIAIVVSSTSIPYWYYGLTTVVTVVWLCSLYLGTWRGWTASSVVVVWVVAAGIELPYHFLPNLTPTPARAITVIGDSITAGMGDDDSEITWPAILAQEHGLVMQDLSHVGDRAATAVKRIQRHTVASPLIMVEIGGNDLLGGAPPEKFYQDLDDLLARLCKPGRQVVVFELPLPPLSHEYGRIQRPLARRHGAKLVPKWVSLSVRSPREATLDTIHLSQEGHRAMADSAWRVIGNAFQ